MRYIKVSYITDSSSPAPGTELDIPITDGEELANIGRQSRDHHAIDSGLEECGLYRETRLLKDRCD